jgi:cell division transport system permease protein
MRLAFREALIAFSRAPLLSALSVTTIAFSLFALGLFGLVAVNIRRALERVEQRVEVRAFIADDASIDSVSGAMQALAAMPEVARVDYVSKDQALQRARRDLGEFSDVFEGEFLPASMEIRLRPGLKDQAQVKALVERVRAYSVVDDVRYGEEWVDKLYRVRDLAAITGLILGVAFAAVSVIIIGSTIRMAVLARSREISIMRLVGATDNFIRAPFLIEGFAKGVLGGALALVLTWVASQLVSRYLLETQFFEPSLMGLGVLGGAVIGLLGSSMSVGRHLRKV